MTIGGNAASIATDGVTSATAANEFLPRVAIFQADVLSTDSGFTLNCASNSDVPSDATDAVSVWLFRVNEDHSVTDVTTVQGGTLAAPSNLNLNANAAEGGIALLVAISWETTVTFNTISGVTQVGTRHNGTISNGGSMVAGWATDIAAATPRTIGIGDTSVNLERHAVVSITLEAL